MDSPPTGAVVVDELKRQAREEGYVVVAVPRDDVHMWLMYLLGVVLGLILAGRE